MPVILANQKQRNILNECNNSCYNLVKDEDETMKNETQQFVLQEYKELHGKMFLLSIEGERFCCCAYIDKHTMSTMLTQYM